MYLVNYKKYFLILLCLFSLILTDDSLNFDNLSTTSNDLFSINGKVNSPVDYETTRILVDDGLYVGHLKEDGSFSISNIPSGSYVVEVSSAKSYYEPVRIDINSKGKIRSRKLNLIQPNDVKMLQYPLVFESRGMPNYFMKREQFRVFDILLSPMVLMMIVPLLLVLVLPKLVPNSPELEREMQQTQNLLQPTGELPSMSEFMQKAFGGAPRRSPTARQQNPSTYTAVPRASKSQQSNNH